MLFTLRESREYRTCCVVKPPRPKLGGVLPSAVLRSPVSMLSFSDSSPWPQPKVGVCGKPAGQGLGVNDYSLTLDALHLQHPRLLQRQGKGEPESDPVESVWDHYS
jgi:hypothetical protein